MELPHSLELPESIQKRLRTVVGFVKEREVLSITVALALFAFVTGDWSLASYIVMYGLFAVAYNFCLGRTGILTFGHAAFFGIGAYSYGLLVVHGDVTGYAAWLVVFAGVTIAALAGLAIGALVLRLRGTYLALVTLALAQALWFVAFQLRSVTGGDDGLVGVERPAVGVPGVFDVNLADPEMFFYFALVIFVVSLLVMGRIGSSNFGRVLIAIRENENRARFLGYDVYRYKLAAFVISAAFSGLAGVLYPIFLSVVSPATLHWLLSGEVNFWVILGGLGTFVGPVIGAGVFIVLREWVTAMTPYWKFPVGALIILMVLYAPEGIVPKARNVLEDE